MMVKMEWSCDLCHVIAPSEQALNEHVYGKEHMAKEEELLIASKRDEGNRIEAAELINPNNVKEEWSCALCQVRTTSKQNLNKHLQGKKHKAKEEALIKASKPDESNETEAAQLKNPNNVKEWSCTLSQESTPSKRGLNEHLQGKKHKAKEEELLIASKPASSTTISKRADNSNTLEKQGVTSNEQEKKLEQQVPKEAKEIVSKQPLIHYCEHCKLQCNSESMLASHLSGKKHLSCMQRLKALLGKVNEETRADLVAKTMEENIKPSGNNKKGPALNKDDKSNKLVNEVMTTSSSKELQKLQVGQSLQQVPKKQSKAVKNIPVHSVLCNVECYGKHMLGSHLRGKKHLARMKELERRKEVSVNHTEDANAGVTFGRNEETEVDVNKVVEIIEVKQSIGSHQDEQVMASETMDGSLNEHLQGKKHKAKEEELLIASKPASSTTISKKAGNSNTLEKQGVTSNEQEKKLEQQVPKEAMEIVSKQPLIHYCEHCKLQCNSESMLASHLSGKKHLSCMQRLKDLLGKVNEETRADLVAKTMEENIKPSGNSNKGPALNKDDKSNKLVNEVMTTSSSKELQKLQVGQSLQQVPKKQGKAVKTIPVHCVLCNVECYGEHMLGSHLRGKKHLARMKELESHKGVSVNHTGDANAGVTYGSNEETETDVNKVIEIIEVKQSIGSHQDEQMVASETMDGVPVPSTEEVAYRMEDSA